MICLRLCNYWSEFISFTSKVSFPIKSSFSFHLLLRARISSITHEGCRNNSSILTNALDLWPCPRINNLQPVRLEWRAPAPVT